MAIKLDISLQAQKSRHGSCWENEPNLRTDADDPRLNRPKTGQGPAVCGELIVEIADRTGEDLFGEEL